MNNRPIFKIALDAIEQLNDKELEQLNDKITFELWDRNQSNPLLNQNIEEDL